MPIESLNTGGSGGGNGGANGGPATVASYPTGTEASFLGARTSPALRWASAGCAFGIDDGRTANDRTFATRVRLQLAGGRWRRIHLVYLFAGTAAFRSPIGAGLNLARGTFRATVELANGTQTSSYDSPNTGGTLIPVTFAGARTARYGGGLLVVSDPIEHPDGFWLNTDRTFLPWVRTSYAKGNANDALPAVFDLAYNAPCGAQSAFGTEAQMNALIDAPGINGYNGEGSWGAGDNESLPTCLGCVGEAMDGQLSVLGFGTSIALGAPGDITSRGPGVNPPGETPAAYDGTGFHLHCAKALDTSWAFLSLACGGASLGHVWSDGADWASPVELALQRELVGHLGRWFDVALVHDVQNDASGDYAVSLRRMLATLRQAGVRWIYGQRVPNGGPDYLGATSPYNPSLDDRYGAQEAAASAGLMDGMLDIRLGGKTFPVLADRYVGPVTAIDGNTLTLGGMPAKIRQWYYGAFVEIPGKGKGFVAGSVGNAIQVSLDFAPTVGDVVVVKGNTNNPPDDVTHGNAYFARVVGANRLRSELLRVRPEMPTFTRTA